MYRTIVEENPKNIAIMDVFSKLMQHRVIFIDDAIDDSLANSIIAQLLYLDSISTDEITIYINSPGGSVYAGLAIYDISKIITAPVKTVGIGCVASMGAVLMLMGSVRKSLVHTRYMLHQVSSGTDGKLSDMQISLEEAKDCNEAILKILEEKLTIENLRDKFRDDYWFGRDEALKIGLLTE